MLLLLRLAIFVSVLILMTGCGGDGGVLGNLASLNPNPVADSLVPSRTPDAESEEVVPEEPPADSCVVKVKGTPLRRDVFQTERIVHVDSPEELKAFSSDGEVNTISEEQKWVALKKNHCALSAEWYEKINVVHEPKAHPSMRRVALDIRLRGPMTLQAFEDLAKREPCLLSVSAVKEENDKSMAAGDWLSGDPRASQQSWIQDIRLTEGLDVFFADDGINQDVIIADIDTGVHFFHEDLQDPMLWRQPNGLIGYNTLDPSLDATDEAANGAHGSKIAGIIGALSNNQKGIVGMFPRNIKVLAVKYFDAQGGTRSADRLNGFEFAVANGADVINLSIGFATNDTTFRQMIEDFVAQGGFVAASAGNDGKVAATVSHKYPGYWGHQIDGMMSVGGTVAGTDRIWTGSNYGTDSVEIVAPGANVYTTFPWNPNNRTWGNYYGTVTGTSYSGPMVAAAAGMVIGYLKAKGIAYTGADIEEYLKIGSRKNASLASQIQQGRQLDLGLLAEAVAGNQDDPACP